MIELLNSMVWFFIVIDAYFIFYRNVVKKNPNLGLELGISISFKLYTHRIRCKLVTIF